jgi:hypothetical protein
VAPAAPQAAPLVPAVAPAIPRITAPVPLGAPRPSGAPPAAAPRSPGQGPAVAPAMPMITPVIAPAVMPVITPAVAAPPGAPTRPSGPQGAPAARPSMPAQSRPSAPAIVPPPPAPIAPPPPPPGADFDPFAGAAPEAQVAVVAAASAAPLPAPVPQFTLPAAPFPETGAIEVVTPAQAVALAQIVGRVSQVDYFQLLRVTYEAKPPEIKKAFYRESRTFHPDRFFHLPESEVKGDISTIYKRITEAYYFLRDDTKRKKYVADISGAERKAKLRFTEISEVEAKQQVKKEQEEQIGTHPKGRALYATALKDFDARRFSDAQRNLKSALMYERDNARYKEKLAEVEQKLHDEFKSKGDQFKIR